MNSDQSDRETKRQYAALFKKIVTVKSRKRYQILADFVFPIVLLALLTWTKTVLKDTDVPEVSVDTQSSFFFNQNYPTTNITEHHQEDWIADFFSKKILRVAIYNQNMNSTLFNEIISGNNTICPTEQCPTATFLCLKSLGCPTVTTVDSADGIEPIFKEDTKGFWAGLVFSQDANGAPSINIRQNLCDGGVSGSQKCRNLQVPSSAGDFGVESIALTSSNSGFDITRPSPFYDSGYLYLMSALSSRLPGAPTNPAVAALPIIFKNLPNSAFVIKADLSFITSYFVLMFLPFAVNLSREMLLDKERKIKQSMQIMGLKPIVFWAAWMSYALIVGFLIGFLIIAVGFAALFKGAPGGLLILSVVLWIFSLIAMVFCSYAVFDKARDGAVAMLLLGYIVPVLYSFIKTTVNSAPVLLAFSLFPQVAFYESMFQLLNGFKSVTVAESTAGYPFSLVLIMQAFDFFLWSFLAWYLDQVLPSEFGVRQPWYFPLSPSYWRPSQSRPSGNELESSIAGSKAPGASESIEEVTPDIASRPSVRLHGLVKIFQKHPFRSSPEDKVAVNGISFSMYAGQIFSLLGHNGAGKSTTINMLVGMSEATKGNFSAFGYDSRSQITEIQKTIGYCPQHDILVDELTVEEHLRLFAIIKGCPPNRLEQEVTDAIARVGLEEKRHSTSDTLSGGMKRRLSVSIAFVCGSKFLVLDEPTAGMDPVSRRQIWDMIQANRDGRVILLTTHFMDEADLLGDRIGIVAQGKLKCLGSSLFLKSRFGLGYYLVLTRTAACDSSEVLALLKRHVPTCSLQTDSAQELAFRLPLDEAHNFGPMLNDLEASLDRLKVSNYGLSMTTLEEVFLRVADESEEESEQTRPVIPSLGHKSKEDRAALKDALLSSNGPTPPSTFTAQVLALLKMRMQLNRQRLRALIIIMMIPLLFVILACVLAKKVFVAQGVQVPLQFIADGWPALGADNTGLNSFGYIAAGAQAAFLGNLTRLSPVFGLGSAITLSQLNADSIQFMTNDINNKLLFSTPGAYQLTATNLTIWINPRSLNSAPILYNAWLDLIRFNENPDAPPVKFISQPLAEAKLAGAGSLVSFYLLIGAGLLPSYFVYILVEDRKMNTKHQMRLMGLNLKSYWSAAFIHDFFMFQISSASLTIVFAIAQVQGFVETKVSFIAIMLAVFPLSGIPLAYAFSFLIDDPASSRVAIFMGNLASLLPYIAVIILSLLNYPAAAEAITYLFSFLPTFVLITSLTNLSSFVPDYPVSSVSELLTLENISSFSGGKIVAPGQLMLFLGLSLFVWGPVTWAIERKWFQRLFKFRRQNALLNLPPKVPDQDDDVAAERQRVEGSTYNNLSDLVQIRGMQHVYPPRGKTGFKVAVHNLSLAVKQGECLGLLGPNGAGKTTAMRVLTGDEKPTAGTFHVDGHNISTDIEKAYRVMGYCPQFDALYADLTARQHLELFAKLKGLKADQAPRAAEEIMKRMDLAQYADIPAGQYSGGNKRKLNAAIALISDPLITYLDEPSTGMDPKAKRQMWNLITDIMVGRAVVLTTHSMEEADALCTRIGIMINGQLVCLGNAQHLKNKFGSGYKLEIKSNKTEQVREFVYSVFPKAVSVDDYGLLQSWKIPPDQMNLAEAFTAIEKNKAHLEISDYSLSQTSLEQIFLSFSKAQIEETAPTK